MRTTPRSVLVTFAIGSVAAVFVLQIVVGGMGERPILVEGRIVRDDGSPASRQWVSVRSDRGGWSSATAALDDGSYAIGVPGSGEYLVLFGGNRLFPTTGAAIDVGPVDRIFHLMVPSTSTRLVFVNVHGAPLRELIQIWWKGPIGPSVGRGMAVVSPDDAGRTVANGWQPGRYVLHARAASGETGSMEIEVTLDKTDQVRLVLARRPGVLTVSDERGHRISSTASIQGVALSEIDTGSFSLIGAAPTQELLIAADGFATMCHVMLDEDWPRLDVRLAEAAGTFRVRLEGASAVIGSLAGARGSTCAITLAQLMEDAQRLPGGILVTLRGLYEGGYRYTLDHPAFSSGLALDPNVVTSVLVPPRATWCYRPVAEPTRPRGLRAGILRLRAWLVGF